MKINEFVDVINSIREIVDNDDIDVVVVEKKKSERGVHDPDLKFNNVNQIQFDRENKTIQIYYHGLNTTD